jgi:uncharacterized phage-like protein YoqJ
LKDKLSILTSLDIASKPVVLLAMEVSLVIITGIAHPPGRLYEKSSIPSNELVYLASKAIIEYKATGLITSLEPGWEQALTKAAVELKIPFTIAIPYPGRDAEWSKESRIQYYELLSRADQVYQINDQFDEANRHEAHQWQIDRADIVLALWNYEFSGYVFEILDYALAKDVQVRNLWQDWRSLFELRKSQRTTYVTNKREGAQVF